MVCTTKSRFNKKLKIYEFVKIICDIFIFIIENEAATNSLIATGLLLKKSLPVAAKLKHGIKTLMARKITNGIITNHDGTTTQNTERNIPNLVFIVKNLDDIIKTCSDTQLQSIFNKFKDNLTLFKILTFTVFSIQLSFSHLSVNK